MAKDKVYFPKKITPEELPSLVIANELNSLSLNTQLNQILGSYTFGQLGAIQIGKYLAGVSGDLKITPSGIVARNNLNVTTFSLNGDTGDAYFAGTLAAGIVQTSMLAFTPTDSSNVVATINASSEGIEISAAKISISGSTSFSAGYNPTDKLNHTGGGYKTASSGPRVLIFPDSSTGIQAIDDGGTDVFKVIVGGSDVGDVIIGNYSGNNGIKYDKSAGETTFKGTVIISHSDNSVNSKLRFEGNSRIWEDSGNDMGLNAIGGEFIIYTNSGQRAYFGENNINLYTTTTYIKNINMGFDGQSEGTISNLDRLMGYNDLRIIGNGDVTIKRDSSDNNGVRIEWGTGKIHSYSSTMDLGGTDKTAIVPTKDGYKSLYCAESPEVWFFDFCANTLKESIDPLFLEVTEGPYKFIQLIDGSYQIWGKRKGHAHKRFESKTALQFKRNEEFLQLSKC